MPTKASAGPRFTDRFSIAIQTRWKFRFTLTSILIQWLLQNSVHDTTAVCCRGMCKNLLWSDGQQRNYGKAKFPSNLTCGQKNVSETGPRHGIDCVGQTTCVLLFQSWLRILGSIQIQDMIQNGNIYFLIFQIIQHVKSKLCLSASGCCVDLWYFMELRYIVLVLHFHAMSQ